MPKLLTRTTCLYVGDLSNSVTETVLFDIFSKCGHITFIELRKNTENGNILHHAFIGYQNVSQANEALEELNQTIVSGKPIRIMHIEEDSKIRRNCAGNIVIKNLEKSIDARSFYETFRQFGNIRSSKLVLDEEGTSRGYGFIDYEDSSIADYLCKKINGMLILNKMIRIVKYISRERRIRFQQIMQKCTTILIKNIESSLREDDLQNLFSSFGDIKSHCIVNDENGISKGYGFVSFSEKESAHAAVRGMNLEYIRGKQIYVAFLKSKLERQKFLQSQSKNVINEKSFDNRSNLYLKNLHHDVDEELLIEQFSKFGPIISVKVMRENDISKCFGFVSYLHEESACKANSAMDGKLLRGKKIYVRPAECKQDRVKRLAAYFSAQKCHKTYLRNENYNNDPSDIPADVKIACNICLNQLPMLFVHPIPYACQVPRLPSNIEEYTNTHKARYNPNPRNSLPVVNILSQIPQQTFPTNTPKVPNSYPIHRDCSQIMDSASNRNMSNNKSFKDTNSELIKDNSREKNNIGIALNDHISHYKPTQQETSMNTMHHLVPYSTASMVNFGSRFQNNMHRPLSTK